MDIRTSQERQIKLVAYELPDSNLFGLLDGLGLVWFSIQSVTSIYKTILYKKYFDFHMKNWKMRH